VRFRLSFSPERKEIQSWINYGIHFINFVFPFTWSLIYFFINRSALITAMNMSVNPLRRSSITAPTRRTSHGAISEKETPQKVETEKEKFAARASRRLSKRELVLEENLSPPHHTPNPIVHHHDEAKVMSASFQQFGLTFLVGVRVFGNEWTAKGYALAE
jgi:hypothetical protein